MKYLDIFARKKDCYRLFLQAAEAKKEAIRLYESLGYVKDGYLRRHFYVEDFIVFSKFIKTSENGQ